MKGDDWRREPRPAAISGIVRRVPNKRAPGVRLHAFGIHDDLWARIEAAAKYNGDEKQISEIVRKALLAYVKRTEAAMRAEKKREAGQ